MANASFDGDGKVLLNDGGDEVPEIEKGSENHRDSSYIAHSSLRSCENEVRGTANVHVRVDGFRHGRQKIFGY